MSTKEDWNLQEAESFSAKAERQAELLAKAELAYVKTNFSWRILVLSYADHTLQ